MKSTNVIYFLFIFYLSLFDLTAAQRPTCVPGEYNFRGSCIECPRNTYSNFANQTRCEACPKGTTSRKGSEAFERCKPCPRGTFYDSSLKSPVCGRCPINTYTDREGLKKCIPCPGGTVSKESAKSQKDCIACPVGLVVTRKDSRPFRPTCKKCPNGQATFNTSSETCKNCPKGMFRKAALDKCMTCPPGTFANRTGLWECEKCPLGMFQNEEGATRCKKCPKGSSTKGAKGSSLCRPDCVSTLGCKVKSCPAGFELKKATGRCNKCSEMHVSSTRSTTPCAQCQTDGEAMANEARTRCICMPGYTRSINGNCIQCPINTSNEDGGKCKCLLSKRFKGLCQCPPLTIQVRNRCVPCNPRFDPSCENCEPAQFFNKTSFRCEDCPANTFRGFNEYTCRPCPGNSTSEAGSFVCDCGPGKGLQNGKCDICPPGTFQTLRKNFRSLKCETCNSGRYQDKSGATSCKRCPRRFAPTRFGSTKCLDECPPNSRRNLPFNDVCRCRQRFTNTGTKDNPICERKV